MRVAFFIVFLISFFGYSQVWIHPNRGQWDNEIKYLVELDHGQLFIDEKGFTFCLFEQNHLHKNEKSTSHSYHFQVIKSHFENSNWKGNYLEGEKSNFYRNYFLGNDVSRWKTEIQSVKQIILVDFYDGIDLILDGSGDKLKYSFLVKPNIDPSIIIKSIRGSNTVSLKDESLHIDTEFGEIIEEKPIAWTIKNGKKTRVETSFNLLPKNKVSFIFPKNYRTNDTLIIDPYLVFSSFSGSTADNWGMTATPDSEGNLYAGGIVFSGAGSYPTVAGSYDITFNGGNNYSYTTGTQTSNMPGFDIAISKFNTLGTELIYSTYLGGSGNEAPHSLVTDENNNLYVLGVTGSNNFPTSNGCYDQTFNGGPTIAQNELGYNGTDIIVTRFNAAGNALIGSTYVGGSGTDGVNIGTLNYNYGDPFRGEIITKNGYVYVSSTTQSTNFPSTGGSQNNLNGTQDAVIFKMNNTLTSMQWSTYFGGSGLETGNSLQIASNGNLYVTGGTNSSNLSFSQGNDLTYNGGISDGYVIQIQGSSATVLSGTYMGLNDYDQAYFVQLNLDNEVFVYGQTESSWPVSVGVYGNPNSGQFIRKYSSNLMNILWTTMIGAGTGHPEISPTAFLVSDCNDIYISGWGGTINSLYGNQASHSTSNGFPITADAYQSITNGSNFYIAVLGQDASTLKYGTYMGGTSSSYNHVDGGTSRFDKSGRIYHAVCGGCGGQDYGFTSTPEVFSPTNNSSNCNLAAFKFELSTIDANISNPATTICVPNPLIITNNSTYGNTYLWDFGDGSTSNTVNPSHIYTNAGSYTVSLTVSDSNDCYTADSIEFEVQVGDFHAGVSPVGEVCPGEPFQLEAFGGSSYYWTPATFLSNSSISSPIATISQTTTFSVVVTDSCGIDTLNVTVTVGNGGSVSNDTSICIGESVTLHADGGSSYTWTPTGTLDDATSQNPLATPGTSTLYVVEIVSDQGCVMNDSIFVVVIEDFPTPELPDSLIMCFGKGIDVVASGGETYHWFPDSFIDNVDSCCVFVNPPNTTEYYCDFTNACGTMQDSLTIHVHQAHVTAENDTTICRGQTAQLIAQGAQNYSWIPSSGVDNPTNAFVFVNPQISTLYTVIGQDEFGCYDSAYVQVNLFPSPYIQADLDFVAYLGDEIQLGVVNATEGLITWSPPDFLSCTICSNPVSTTDQRITYQVTVTDTNGCKASDYVAIGFDPILYIPNTFTPDNDKFNNVFQIVIKNVKSFEMNIYDRWGELISTFDSMDEYWDGYYKNKMCQDGTYVWKLTYTDLSDKTYERVGHINLIR